MKRAAVDTLLGLHSRVAPNACHAPSSRPGEAFIAKHGVHDGYTLGANETLCWGYTHSYGPRLRKSRSRAEDVCFVELLGCRGIVLLNREVTGYQ